MTPMTSRQARIVAAHEKCKSGEPITDQEVRDVCSQEFDGLLTFIKALGPEFHFMWKDLWLFRMDVERMKEARQRPW